MTFKIFDSMRRLRFLFSLAVLLLTLPCAGQVIELLRPMYFTGGIPLQGPVDKSTASLKFQLSASIAIWQGKGEKEGMALRFGYTQTSVWDFFDKSAPFRDNTYVPGLYFQLPLQQSRLLLGLEHRSNGRPMRGTEGDTHSRSVNYLLAEYRAYLSGGLVLKAAGRFGFGWYDDEATQDVFSRFMGYADLGAGYRSPNGKWELSLDVTPVFGPFEVNINAGVAYHLGACSLYAQFVSGYADSLYDWVRGYRPPPTLRIGVLLGHLL